MSKTNAGRNVKHRVLRVMVNTYETLEPKGGIEYASKSIKRHRYATNFDDALDTVTSYHYILLLIEWPHSGIKRALTYL